MFVIADLKRINILSPVRKYKFDEMYESVIVSSVLYGREYGSLRISVWIEGIWNKTDEKNRPVWK